jgi:hypothetical protein
LRAPRLESEKIGVAALVVDAEQGLDVGFQRGAGTRDADQGEGPGVLRKAGASQTQQRQQKQKA